MADVSFDEQMKLAMAASLKDHKEEKPKETLQPLSGLVDLFDKAAEIKHRLSEHWVATETDFWYYNCKDEIDRGWGCTYRVIQTIFDNLKRQKRLHLDVPMPTLRNIQETLANLPGYDNTIVGSKRWLEPPDTNRFFRTYSIDGYDSTYETKTFQQKSVVISILTHHFQTLQTPIMTDDKMKTMAVMGIGKDKEGNYYVLIFDPHIYVRVSPKYEDFRIGKHPKVGWKPFDEHFKKKKWMIYFPLRSSAHVDGSPTHRDRPDTDASVCGEGCRFCVVS
ncbi:hypothetical protein AAMO2058_000071000 [Amorphochlora amoebiformis]